MPDKIIVIGAGAWGTALASAWASSGKDVTLLARSEEQAQSLRKTRENTKYLPNISLPKSLHYTHDFQCLRDAQHIAFVVPTQSLTDMLSAVKGHLPQKATGVLCCKGIDQASGLLPYDLLKTHAPRLNPAVLSGPSFATDVAAGKPTAVTLAHANTHDAESLCARLATPALRLYANNDVTGVELGGALKNVIALAVGMARGLELGASAEAALIARGFAELGRLGEKAGARRETLTGLSGLGDLVLTCSSPQSRNFSYGMALAREEDLSDRPLAEGVHTASMASKLARQHACAVPIIDAVVDVLKGQSSARMAAHSLLARPLKNEI